MGRRKATSAARRKKKEESKSSTTTNPDQMEFGRGSTIKNAGYLKTIIINIAYISNHPRKKGIKMQAHHLISATAMKGLPPQVKRNIEYFNYNINQINNLAFLPSTLQGACHLGVQPHIGNHVVKIGSENDEECEDDHKIEMDYHHMVRLRMLSLRPLTMTKCIGECSHAQLMKLVEDVKNELDKISAKVLNLIQKKPEEAPLTRLYAHFQPGNPVGCAGVDSVNGHTTGKTNHHGKHQCAINRNHLNAQNPGQQKENIRFELEGGYKLEIGK